MHHADTVIVGAGAAGLHCAAIAGQRGARVVLIDHAARIAEKIRISGGGRCNFTNLHTTAANFLSANPRYTRSALARYTPGDFTALLRRHGVGYHEKHKGQLFCDSGSGAVIEVLLRECDAGRVDRWQPCAVTEVRHGAAGYTVGTDRGEVTAPNLVLATGGLSIPAIGATDFSHRVARQFGLRVTETRPALVPLTFDVAAWANQVPLAGVALPAMVATGPRDAEGRFHEDLLFTHRGLSGPAVLQASSYWQPGQPLHVDLAPGVDVAARLIADKRRSRMLASQALAAWLPRRLAERIAEQHVDVARRALPTAEWTDRDLRALGAAVQRWSVVPNGTEGYRKAEVTLGGVDTHGLDSATMQSRRQPGLYVIGEAADVTGWLGGYNFQWAWASAAAAAVALTTAAVAAL